jgi:hypothetical protein
VTVHALHLALGTALLPSALKLSAKQVLALPLPVDAAAWNDGAALARDLARARTAAPGPGAVDPAILRKAFVAFGVAMCAAYRVDPDEVLEWWLTRIN